MTRIREVVHVMGGCPVTFLAEKIALQARIKNRENRRDRQIADQYYDWSQPDQPLIETRSTPLGAVAHNSITATASHRVLRAHFRLAADPMPKMLRYSL